jgi:hypothetical protein
MFDMLLKQYVDGNGKVTYGGFIKDSVTLNQYLKLLQNNPPDTKTWTKTEQMAYWINAYNAYTIKLVIRYYPIKSIKDIGSKIQVPFVNTPWDIKFIKIGNESLDLNEIEHIKLRKQFKDPRIHMVLVCASKSCPILLNESYQSSNLEEQLNKQTERFLLDPSRNKLNAQNPKVSMIFNWYSTDFTAKGGSIRSFINAHSPIKIKEGAKFDYLEYDWSLNN